MRTQVAIVGAGPAGLLLCQLLHRQGIESVVLEQRDQEYVQRRVRAGVLEHGSVATLVEAGVSARLTEQGMRHGGTELRFNGAGHRIDFEDLTGRHIVVYGQQEVVKDLIAARRADIRFEVSGVTLHDLETGRPRVRYRHQDCEQELIADLIVGADGFHGCCRGYLPQLQTAQRDYDFAWLGILAEAPPSAHELIYARHDRGFALHSMRSPEITRMYLQVPADTSLTDWPDDRIWDELQLRLATDDGFRLTRGPLLDTSITPLRSFVATPMQHGRLFLAGDAAHIVPPTGAKGMNLAIADVRLLSYGIGEYFATGRSEWLARYTEQALRRVWRSTHFSWWMTTMLHVDPNADSFGNQLATAQLDYVTSSRAMATALAENYTGLPYERDWFYR